MLDGRIATILLKPGMLHRFKSSFPPFWSKVLIKVCLKLPFAVGAFAVAGLALAVLDLIAGGSLEAAVGV